MAPWDYMAQQPNAPMSDSGYSDPGNYASSLNLMLQPYQQMAQQYSQPFNAFQPNSILGHLIPQGLQGALSNGILTGSMVQQGNTPGQNFSNVLGAMVGANQFNRQRAMQGAMLPYQMIQPQLNAERDIASMGMDQARMQYYGQEGQWRQSEIQKNERDPYGRAVGSPIIDDQGHAWQSTFDPVSGGVKQMPLEPVPQGYQPTFKQHLKAQSATNANVDYTQSGILRRMASPDPAVRQQAQADAKNFSGLESTVAGQRTGAEQTAKTPQIDVDSEVKSAEQEFNAPKPMSPGQFSDLNKLNPEFLKDPTGSYSRYAAQATSQYTQQKQQYDQKVSQYRDAARRNPSLRWHDFLQQSASQGPTSGGTSTPSAPSQIPSFSDFISSRKR